MRSALTVIFCLLLSAASAHGTLIFVNASNDRVTYVDTGLDPTTASFCAWIYPTSSSLTRIFDKSKVSGSTGYWRVQGVGTYGLRVLIDYSTTDANASSVDNVIVPNQWNFMCAVWDGSNAPKIYRGDLTTLAAEVSYSATSASSGSRVTDSNAPVVIGNQNGSTGGGYPGGIDLFEWIPGTALSLSQVQSIQLQFVQIAGAKTMSALGRANGTGTQTDTTGTGNGTVTTATLGIAGVPIGVPAIAGVF